jgi:hypothetical protein
VVAEPAPDRLLIVLGARELAASFDSLDWGLAGSAGGLLDFDWKSGMSGMTSMAGTDSRDCFGVNPLLHERDGGLDGGPSYKESRWIADKVGEGGIVLGSIDWLVGSRVA